MTTKTTGAEFKRFYSDPNFWPDDNGKTYHDDERITVNGSVAEFGVDLDSLGDSDKMEIEGGFVRSPKWNDDDAPSLEGYFKRWRREAQQAVFLVECDVAKLDAVKAAIRAAGGRVV